MDNQSKELLNDLKIKPGKKHLEYYDNYFSSQDILNGYIEKISHIFPNLPEKVNVTEIGAGTGILGQAIKGRLQDRSKRATLSLVEKEADTLEYNTDQQTDKFVGDNKDNPLPDNSQDLVVSRSVVHYEDNTEAINQVLSEVTRILKQTGYFIDQFITFENEVERKLFADIHERLGRNITLLSTDTYKQKLSEFLEVQEVYREVAELDCVQTSDDVATRYDLNQNEVEELAEMINNYSDDNLKHFQTTDSGFQWTVPFSVFINQKL